MPYVSNGVHPAVLKQILLGIEQANTPQIGVLTGYETLKQALQNAEKLSDSHGKCDCYLVMARCERRLGMYQKAIQSATRSKVISLRIGYKIGTCKANLFLGHKYVDEGDYPGAMQLFLLALADAKASQQRVLESDAQHEIGDIYYYIGDHGLAFEHQSLALEITRELGDEANQSQILGCLGSTYYERGELQQYKTVIEESVQLARRAGTPFQIGITLSNLAACYERLAEYELSVQIAQQALAQNRQVQSRFELKDLTTLGSCYFEKAKHGDDGAAELSEKFYTEAIQLLDRDPNFPVFDRCNTLSRMGSLYAITGRTEEAKKCFLESLELAKTHGILLKQKDAEYLLYEIYKGLQKADVALTHFEHFHKLNEQLFKESSDVRFRTLQVAQLLTELQHKSEIASQRANNLEQQLSNSTLQLIAQTELLSELRDGLLQFIHKFPLPDGAAKELRERLKTLPCKAVDWEKFDTQFKAAHPEFTKKLIEKFPALSPTELRICSLLRMNLKSEDIARLLCLSARSVEFHRYNIRKKLGLKTDQHLPNVLGAL
jgi:tetratricopeptide (TPR) repeat protein